MSRITNPPAAGSAPSKNYARVWEALGFHFHANGDTVNLRAEECPWCGGEKCYLNHETGLYDCKSGSCGQSGNTTTFLTHVHGLYLAATTAEDRTCLGKLRGFPYQTVERHELAYMRVEDAWLIPFKSSNGNVVNLMRYYPNKPKKHGKYMLPELPTALYGFDELTDPAGKDKDVLLCEGPFDAMALDYSLGHHRGRYVIAAVPGSSFKPAWAEHFKDRRVRVFGDNDEAGRELTQRIAKSIGETGIAAELKALRWPDGLGLAEGYDLNDLVRDRRGRPVLKWLLEHCYGVVQEPKLVWKDGWGRVPAGSEVIDWIWPSHLRTKTYASFSGERGTLKSTIVRELIARFTTGRPMPDCHEVGLPPAHVIYITAEDGEEAVWADLERRGADMNRVSILTAEQADGGCLNVLDVLEEIRSKVRAYGTRWIVIDG
jgi:hypothetical protein